MSTPWPVLLILTFYLLFVLKLGPMMMKNHEPFNIKRIIMVYNLIQTLYNFYIISDVSFKNNVFILYGLSIIKYDVSINKLGLFQSTENFRLS